MQPTKQDKNYEENLLDAEKLVYRELEYEDVRYEQINRKAAAYVGFTSIILTLLLRMDTEFLRGLSERVLSISLLYIFYLGLSFVVLSVIFALKSYSIKKFQRPNIRYSNDGLLKDGEMEKPSINYKSYILKQVISVVLENAKQNDNNANFVRYATYAFGIGFILIIISLMLVSL